MRARPLDSENRGPARLKASNGGTRDDIHRKAAPRYLVKHGCASIGSSDAQGGAR